MAEFGERSLEKRSGLCPELQEILDDAIKVVDFGILDGHRSRAQHNDNLKNGVTTVKYEKSYHSRKPSHAADLYPYDPKRKMYLTGSRQNIEDFRFKVQQQTGKPFSFAQARSYQLERMAHVAGVVQGVAIAKGYTITSGRDWNRDGDTLDTKFKDYPHVQIEGIKYSFEKKTKK